MKFILLIALSFFTAQISSAEIPPPSNSQPEEIRKAKVIATIQKTTIHRNGNNISVTEEKVCDATSEVSVYELRLPEIPPMVSFGFAECKSTLDGKNITLSAYGFMGLRHHKTNNVIDGDIKFASISLSSFENTSSPTPAPPKMLPSINGYMATRDLTLKSMITVARPDIWTGPSLNEWFSIEAEFVDDAQ